MPPPFPIPSHDELVVSAYLVAEGNASPEFARWKLDHPDWFEAATWTPKPVRRPHSQFGRRRGNPVPHTPGPVEPTVDYRRLTQPVASADPAAMAFEGALPIAGVPDEAAPGVVTISADGMDLPRALAGAVIAGGIVLYMRQMQEKARRAGSRPGTTPLAQLPAVVEAAVPLPPPKEGETPAEVLKPGGQLVGEAGTSKAIRVLPGGEQAAEKLFDRLTKGGTDITPPDFKGKIVRLPNGNQISYRPTSKSELPTIEPKNFGRRHQKT